MRSKQSGWAWLVGAGITFCAADAWADGLSEIHWGFQLMGLMGGLAFFLFGMELMSDGMQRAAGDRLRTILANLTKNKYRGMLLGIVVTMLVQSGSATSVMLVGFVQAGLMQFMQTIGVLIGSGIGMTITAQLIAFKVTDYALLMIVAGFLIRLLAKRDTVKSFGDVLLGFGVLFYGLKLMGDSMRPLRSSQEVITLLSGLENRFLGLLIGVVLTTLIQSSTAFIGILIVLGLEGLISLEASIPMVLGANIGTCVTAGFASIGANRDAKRVALANVMIRVIGVMLFIGFIPEFTWCISWLGDEFNSDIARQIANAHSVFNIAIGIIVLPFSDAFARLIVRMLPETACPIPRYTTTFLDESKIFSPALAVDLARSEISRMASALEYLLKAVAVPFVTQSPKRDKVYPELTLMEGIDMREEEIDFLEEKITDYLLKVARSGASDAQLRVVYAMVSIVRDMESIGDIIHRNVLPLIRKKHELAHDFSEEGREELTIYHQKVCKQIRLLKEAFAEQDLEKAQRIMVKERKYLDLELQYRVHHLDRLVGKQAASVETHEVHTELMNLMVQIIVYSSNIAKTFLETETREKALLI
ncbi:Na/Pi cotransporter family protein [Desulfoluna spongiiphila]|uniref:Phosphate:Na+ symporter n=1 Tax=Desulfoluna spongiiphila TaxID=419481 RepID=A0A1G5I2F0_9BACT|nr:Na/Pi cotransporter family protein [Desulfoluna spongiiphila]SCY70207.1 phosphate:Na+ symporter [Desulfoluna spongiiphila]VVS92663.1 sodium-dependent phosphate transport protein [Desulfoluna spongiiphila]